MRCREVPNPQPIGKALHFTVILIAMGELQFDDQTNEFGVPPKRSEGSDITGKIIAWGLAKDRAQAQTVLAIIGGVALLIAAYLMFFSGGGSADVPATPNYGGTY
jgi:hypothetical protein